MLRDIEHLSIEETSKALGISTASVKTRLLRARLMLRDLLAPGMAVAGSAECLLRRETSHGSQLRTRLG